MSYALFESYQFHLEDEWKENGITRSVDYKFSDGEYDFIVQFLINNENKATRDYFIDNGDSVLFYLLESV